MDAVATCHLGFFVGFPKTTNQVTREGFPGDPYPQIGRNPEESQLKLLSFRGSPEDPLSSQTSLGKRD